MVSAVFALSSEKFCELARTSRSVGHLLQSLGLRNAGSNYNTVRQRMIQEGIDYKQFIHDCRSQCMKSVVKKLDLNEVLCENSSRRVKKKQLVDAGLLVDICAKCGNEGLWLGEKLSLQLDHLNGDSIDNRIENLRILCPNCHSQTSTFAGRNSRKNFVKQRTQKEYFDSRRIVYAESQKSNVECLRNSGIDFSKRGWVGKVGCLIGLKHQKVRKWMQRFASDLLHNVA